MQTSHRAFGSDVDIILNMLHLPLSPVGVINWVDFCRYLGVFFSTGCTCFFRAFNALYSKVGRLASVEVVLSFIRAKCLPILLYATEACPLLSRNNSFLNLL